MSNLPEPRSRYRWADPSRTDSTSGSGQPRKPAGTFEGLRWHHWAGAALFVVWLLVVLPIFLA